jgi:hypothetical protein
MIQRQRCATGELLGFMIQRLGEFQNLVPELKHEKVPSFLVRGSGILVLFEKFQVFDFLAHTAAQK